MIKYEIFLKEKLFTDKTIIEIPIIVKIISTIISAPTLCIIDKLRITPMIASINKIEPPIN